MSNPLEAWQKIIQGLVPDIPLSVKKMRNGNLVIEADQPLNEVKNLLQSASPETIQRALSWELRAQGQDGIALDDIEILTQSHGSIADDVLETIANKSNRELFEEGIYKAFKKAVTVDCNLVYDTDTSGRICVQVDVSALEEEHQAAMSHIMLDSLRRWFYKRSSGEILQYVGSAMSNITLRDEVSDADSQKWQTYKEALLRYDHTARQIIFDMSLLKELMFPPRVHQQQHTVDHGESAETKHKLTVNIQHLFNFLSRSNDWVIAPSPESDDKKGIPILFAKPLEACASKIQVLLYLDGSASMKSEMPAYNAAIKDLINELRAKFSRRASDLHICYRTFSDEVSDTKTIAPNQSTISWCVHGGTALYDAVETANRDIQGGSPNDITVVVFITDGQNNMCVNAPYIIKPSKDNLTAMQGFHGNTYVIGQGEQYDRALCQEIADMTGGSHIQVNQMQEIMDQLTGLDKVFSFYEVTLTDENGDAKTMPIRISNEQLLEELPAIEEGASITINGEQLFAHQSQPLCRSSVSSGTAYTDQADDSAVEGNGMFDKRHSSRLPSKCVVM